MSDPWDFSICSGCKIYCVFGNFRYKLESSDESLYEILFGELSLELLPIDSSLSNDCGSLSWIPREIMQKIENFLQHFKLEIAPRKFGTRIICNFNDLLLPLYAWENEEMWKKFVICLIINLLVYCWFNIVSMNKKRFLFRIKII